MSGQSPNRRRILLVSDQALTGLAIRDELEEDGYLSEGPVSVEMTIEWLATSTPDAAVLDVRVSEPRAAEIARVLKERGVHFIVVSSSDRRRRLPAFSDVPWVEKPWPNGRLRELVGQLIET